MQFSYPKFAMKCKLVIYCCRSYHLIDANNSCPEYFNQDFLNKIKVGDPNAKNSQANLSSTLDWRVKSSNLKKLIEYINDFLDSVLETNHHRESVQVDAVLIARDSSVMEITKLLQLILASAVNCEKQEDFVQTILQDMDVEDQLNVKKALEPFISTTPSSLNYTQIRPTETNGRDNRTGDTQSKSSKRFSGRSNDDSLAQELFDLKREVSSLRDQNVALSDQNDDLMKKNLQLQQEINNISQDGDMISTRSKGNVSTRDGLNSGYLKSGAKGDLLYGEDDEGELMSFKDQEIIKLKKKMDALKEDLFRTSNQRDQLLQTIEYLKSQLNEESAKREDMTRKLQEMKSLKDEVDILRSKNEQFRLNEVSVENYRKKIEELNEVIHGMKYNSSGNTRSSNTNLTGVKYENGQKFISSNEGDREETIRNLKSQNDVLKKQIQETNSALAELTSVSMKKEMELMQVKDRLEILEEQKSKYEQELIDQSNIIVNLKEELKSNMSGRNRGSSYEPPDPLLYSIGHPDTPAEDLLTQLGTSDNSELKKRIDELKKEVLLKESLLHDHILRIRDLENENHHLKNSSEVMNDVKGSSFSPGDEAGEQLAVARDQCQELQEKLTELEQLLVKKDEEINELNERYKRCVSKAKQVARVLEVPLTPPGSSPGSNSGHDVSSANNQSSPYHHLLPHHTMYQQSQVTAPSSFEIQMQQLMSLVTERDKTISELELEHEKMKAFKDVEERLMSVAFHSLVSNVVSNVTVYN